MRRSREKTPARSPVKTALLWLFLIGMMGFGCQRYTSHLTGQRQEKPLFSNGTELVVRHDVAGHYILPGKINGHDVRFLIDTGATRLTIPAAAAARLQLTPEKTIETSTASGITASHTTTVSENGFRNQAGRVCAE